jgi:hypothetical protein
MHRPTYLQHFQEVLKSVSRNYSLFYPTLLAIFYTSGSCGRDSSVGIATGYGLNGPGIESRWGRDFSHMSRPALGLTQPPVQWVPGRSRG